MNPRPVTVGVDGTLSARQAARWAAVEAELLGAALEVVAVGDRDTAAVAAREGLTEARDAATVPMGATTRRGDPVEVLVEESAHSRLLVLGNRGLGALRGLLSGSVSGPVAARAHCPVAVVRGPERLRDERPVVLGVDGTPAGEGAIGYAFEAADRRAVPLIAVHVWRDELDDPEWASAFVDVDPTEQERELLSERLAGWSARFPDVDLTRVLDDDQPVRALVARSLQASLLVLGTRGRLRAPGRWGSVAGAVLHEAQCPVVVVRPTPVATG
ncbi:MAG TPA: universal stress protein [Actinomycetospora sp.]|uniref:universal stress protein n=1 Tax=Actinomycetospora sp. TaxID=1872135 RepID=UPI002F3E8334